MNNNTMMPALFVGHGSPSTAIEDNEFSRAWSAAGKSLPKPTAILSISAHWLTEGTRVYDWAAEFDETLKQLILTGEHDSIINYRKYGRIADLSVPTNEHFLPMLYILGLRQAEDDLEFFAEKETLGSISMRAFIIG